ncbi:MAG: histidine kinase [Candidatus Limnocylindrales bacterium]
MPGYLRRPWLLALLAAVVVGAVELLSDTVLDQAVAFPLDTVLIMGLVFAVTAAFTVLAARRIDRLSGVLVARNEELEARAASVRALQRVTLATASLTELDAVLGVVVGQARELLGTDVALLTVVDAEGAPALRASSGPAEALDPSGSLHGDEIGRFVRPEYLALRLSAPLQRGDETIGQLMVASRRERAFGVDEVETLASLANQAAIAIENARLHQRLRELAVVEERERIAREMHDGLAQVLGYVNTKSQAVEGFLERGKTAEAQAQLAELAAAARSIYVDVREAILGLRSPVIGPAGLVPAIEDYAARFADASKLAVLVEATLEARQAELPPTKQAHVFRIVQEGLTNARKHAGAQRATINLAVAGDRLTVALDDDGRGFAGAAPGGDGWPHYGLDAMRERAAMIDADIEWSDRPDGGARVWLAVPMASQTGDGA